MVVFLIRYWYLFVIAALVLALTGATLYAKVQRLEAQKAKQELSLAVEVNKENTRVAKELREDWALERAITEKEIAEAHKRASAIDDIKKELENAPDAQKPVGPYFDELSKRLRSLDSGTTD